MIVDSNKWTDADGSHWGKPKSLKRSRLTRYILILAIAILTFFIGAILSDLRSYGVTDKDALLYVPVIMTWIMGNIWAGGSPFRFWSAPFFKREKNGFVTAPPDEVEAAIFARHNVLASRITLMMIAALFGWFAYATSISFPLPQTMHSWVALGMCVCGIGFALPTLIAEWAVPYPSKEEQSTEKTDGR